MLDLLDVLIRDVLLAANIPGLTTPAQIRFQPPNGDMRTDVTNLGQSALCVYLVDLRENRRLRSNERIPRPLNGDMSVEPAPPRVDCHYLISAWSATQPAPGVEPLMEEHLLLYRTAAALMQAIEMGPARQYLPGTPKRLAWPVRFRNDVFPTAVLPSEGFAKLSEFWTTMGQNSPWKPVIYCVITVPVELLVEIQGPMVTTTITDHRILDPESLSVGGDVWLQIGGHVLDMANPLTPVPLARAWVVIEEPGGRVLARTASDANGRFIFTRLRQDTYRLRAGVVGRGTQDRLVDVPSPSGEYDLQFP
ncbi:MAG TPA: Pvc16 family protein [Gemmatimonadales bacterium]|nr:Pvc16 family protein [Gemmatimonadales bacterium]